MQPQNQISRRAGFTLVELMTVITILSVLMSVVWVGGKGLRKRAERIACGENLKGLHVALQSYINDNGHWPQVDAPEKDEEKYWEVWKLRLEKYELSEKVWLCPSHLRATKDLTTPYSSYLPNNFDRSSPFVAHQWANMPWLIEIGDNHGQGPLAIFPDGSIDTTINLEEPFSNIERR